MSLIGTLLAFVVFPLKARPPEPKPDKAVPFALDFWRKTGWALMKEVESLREERDALRAQLQSLTEQQARQIAYYQQALASQHQAQMLAQYQPAQLQQAQALQNYAYQGLGQQNQMALPQTQFQDWCNCVPSRGEVIGNSHGVSG